jgi:Zinc-binding domain of primase-helicase
VSLRLRIKGKTQTLTQLYIVNPPGGSQRAFQRRWTPPTAFGGRFCQVPATALNGKHQACPACGGKDRFRFTDRKGDGDYFCNGCGAGKGISLVAKVNGWSYPEAAKRIDEFLHRPYASRAA